MPTVYTKFIDPKHRREHTDRNVKRKKQSMSLAAYFAEGNWQDVAHHTILWGPLQELLHDIFRSVLADDFSHSHRPGAWTWTQASTLKVAKASRPFASTESEEWYD